MGELLLQGCSKRKADVGKTQAIEVYDGYFYRIIDNSEYQKMPDLSLVILSAEYGLLAPTDRIEPYDREMTPSRAEELRSDVVAELSDLLHSRGVDRLWVNLGRTYRGAIEGIAEATPTQITYLTGRLGTRGNQLKRLLRGRLHTDSPELTTVE